MTGSKQCRIRAATSNDIAEICHIERLATTKFGKIEALADLADGEALEPYEVEEWLQIGRIFLAELDNQIIGFAAAHPQDQVLYIAEISVREDFNGQGIGTTLLSAVCTWAEERAAGSNDSLQPRVSLTTYADVPWNGPWYRKRGFEEVPAETLGPAHVAKMDVDARERGLVRPGYRRCCMLWTSPRLPKQ